MRHLRSIILLLSTLTFITCAPCLISYDGIVVDSISNFALDSVTVAYYQDNHYKGEMITDSTGVFTAETDVHHVLMFKDCDDLKVTFMKKGYNNFTVVVNPSKYDTVRLSTKN